MLFKYASPCVRPRFMSCSLCLYASVCVRVYVMFSLFICFAMCQGLCNILCLYASLCVRVYVMFSLFICFAMC